MTEVPEGSLVTPYADFTDINGAPADPVLVVLSIRRGDGTIDTYTGPELSNPSVGRYEKEITVSPFGVWRWEFDGDGIILRGQICATRSFITSDAGS